MNLRAGDGFFGQQHRNAVINPVNQLAVLGDQRLLQCRGQFLAIELADVSGADVGIKQRYVRFIQRVQALFAGGATQDIKQFFVHNHRVFNDMRIEYAFR